MFTSHRISVLGMGFTCDDATAAAVTMSGDVHVAEQMRSDCVLKMIETWESFVSAWFIKRKPRIGPTARMDGSVDGWTGWPLDIWDGTYRIRIQIQLGGGGRGANTRAKA